MNMRRYRPRGFTLIELAICTALVGILLAVLVPQMRGGQNSARAAQIEQVARSATSNWSTLVTLSGLPSTISNNVIAANPSNYGVSDVLFIGFAAVAPQYQALYSTSGVKVPIDIVDVIGNGNYRLAGSTNTGISMAGGGAAPVTISFTNVTIPMTMTIVRHVKSDQPMLTFGQSGQNFVIGPWTYNCDTYNGVCTITYSKMI